MEEIAKNKYYEMYVDPSKNRVYYTYKGFWESPAVVPDYFEDHKRSVGRTTPGFSGIVDLKDMKTPPQDVMELHMKVQNYSLQHGMKRSAHIIDAALVELASGRFVKETDSKEVTRSFASRLEAEDWLDSY